MCSVAAAAPALSPGQSVPGPPGRPVAARRRLVQSGVADRLADELGDVDAVVADDRGVGPGVGALHVVLAEESRRLHELARRLAAEGLGRRDDARRKRLCGAAADRKVLSDRVGEVIQNGARSRLAGRGCGCDGEEGNEEVGWRHVVVVVVVVDGDGGLRGTSSGVEVPVRSLTSSSARAAEFSGHGRCM